MAQRGTGVRERAKGGYRSPLCNPRSRPATSPLCGSLASISSLQVGRDTASCLSRPQAHIPVGLTWLVNYASARLMPDQSHHCYYSERFSKSALLPWRGSHSLPMSTGYACMCRLSECLYAVEVLRSPGVCGSTRHWCTRTCKGGYRSPLCNPRSRPTTSPLRGSLGSISSLQVGRDTASCLSRPQPHIPVGLTWLVNYASAMLMPDTTPRLTFLCFQ